MGKGFNNYMTKKFFHPSSKENIKRVWMAQQKTEFEKKKEEDMLAQYKKEQDMYENRALLGDEKAKMGLSFMYDAPPGLKKAEKEKEEGEPEYKFEWQRKFNAPREQYAKNDETIRDQPFGIEVRNVRCIKCRQWGHVNTDRICPLFGKDLAAEPPQPKNSASSLLESMREEGFTLKQSLLGRMADPRADNEQMLPSDDEDDPEVQFLKSLTPKQKKKLLKKLNRLQERQTGEKAHKKKKKKKEKKRKMNRSDADSSDEGKRKKHKKSSKLKKNDPSESSDSETDEGHHEKRSSNKHKRRHSSSEREQRGRRPDRERDMQTDKRNDRRDDRGRNDEPDRTEMYRNRGRSERERGYNMDVTRDQNIRAQRSEDRYHQRGGGSRGRQSRDDRSRSRSGESREQHRLRNGSRERKNRHRSRSKSYERKNGHRSRSRDRQDEYQSDNRRDYSNGKHGQRGRRSRSPMNQKSKEKSTYGVRESFSPDEYKGARKKEKHERQRSLSESSESSDDGQRTRPQRMESSTWDKPTKAGKSSDRYQEDRYQDSDSSEKGMRSARSDDRHEKKRRDRQPESSSEESSSDSD